MYLAVLAGSQSAAVGVPLLDFRLGPAQGQWAHSGSAGYLTGQESYDVGAQGHGLVASGRKRFRAVAQLANRLTGRGLHGLFGLVFFRETVGVVVSCGIFEQLGAGSSRGRLRWLKKQTPLSPGR